MTEKRKRGGQCKGDAPMTAAERQQRRREKKKQEQIKQAYFTIEGDFVDRLDRLVEFFGLSGRAEAIRGLIQGPLKQAIEALETIQEQLGSLSDSEDAMKIKREYWKTVTDPRLFPNPLKQQDKGASA